MDEKFRYGLPVHEDEYRTGALPFFSDPRDFLIERIPEVAAMLDVGAPASYDLIAYIKGVYNQGSRPSCVAESTCGMKSIEDMLEHSAWNTYDATKLYIDNGGTGQNGVDTRRVLQYAQDTGLLVLQGTARYRIGSYAFAPRTAGQFEETLKAAIAVNRPCVIALLLPQNFGWESGGAITQGYHQVCVVGYDATYVTILNSWGGGWGKNGLGRVPWSFLTQQNFQNGYVYAYTVIDALDGDLQPPVNKPPIAMAGGPYSAKAGESIAFFGGKSSDPDGTIVSHSWDFGDGLSAVGANPLHTYTNAGIYTATLTVTDNGGATGKATALATIGDVVPPPAPLKIDSYGSVTFGPWVFAKAQFNIKGTFPTVGVLQVFWKDIALKVINRNATLITVEAPDVAAVDAGMVKVQVEGASALGATLTIFPSTAPAPVNKPPIAVPGGPYAGVVGQPVQFDGSGSSDPDGHISRVTWEWGNGEMVSNGGSSMLKASKIYQQPGTYTVTLIVTDNQGADTIATTYVAITAGPPPPVGELKITGTIVRLGASYAAYATVADPSGKSVAGTIAKCTVGSTALPDRTIPGAGVPAIWTIAASLLAPGVVVKISATAPDGRKGELSLIFQPAA